MTYLITFPTYGAHIHGAPEGSVDRHHNRYGGPYVAPDRKRMTVELGLMRQPPYVLDPHRRQVVLEGIVIRSSRRGWCLIAAHVRTNHVHIVIEAAQYPEFVMTELKCGASRQLNELGFDEPTRRRWARHGSTRWLIGAESVRSAVHYVLEGQGEVMARFPA